MPARKAYDERVAWVGNEVVGSNAFTFISKAQSEDNGCLFHNVMRLEVMVDG